MNVWGVLMYIHVCISQSGLTLFVWNFGGSAVVTRWGELCGDPGASISLATDSRWLGAHGAGLLVPGQELYF